MTMTNPTLILASSSPYRQALLAKLKLDFLPVSPDIDETAHIGETSDQLVKRLAKEKSLAIAKHYQHHLIIGSDQVASLEGKILTKPGNFENATDQLTSCSGKTVTFYTGLALYNSATSHMQLCVESFSVTFRQLATHEIKTYLHLEKPFDCAGSFKMEGLGITLFEKLQGEDPNSLIGLPLIKLVTFLRNEGINPLNIGLSSQ